MSELMIMTNMNQGQMQRLTTQNEDDEVDTSVPFDIKPALFSSLRSPKRM